MKKWFSILLIVFLVIGLSAFKDEEEEKPFDVDTLTDYQKEFVGVDAGVCALGRSKTYMDYRAVTARDSIQYWFIRERMTVDEETGFLYDEDGFIGVALGSYYGVIGDRYYFTLDTGVILPVVKIDEKADVDTDASGCYHVEDGSVIEFVIDKNVANEYYGYYGNGLVLSGNFSNYELYRGSIVAVEKVTGERKDDYVTFEENEDISFDNTDIFDTSSGY